ncbi:hypothetical protein WAF17_07610 [Bernardetia sp. ABR2-2B]|uniref:hypothetical protein n=1 Tax=Bernardetia sp. ABR2-2B TaxID=3127472 RepID=UPI0030CC9785
MKRKIGFADVLKCSSIEELKEMRTKHLESIESTKVSMKKSVSTLLKLLQNAYKPISQDTHLFENDNPLDVFKYIEEDIIYINGNVFSIKEKKLKNYTDDNYFREINKETQEINIKFISQMKEYFDSRLSSIDTEIKIINKVEAELKTRRIK